MKRQHLTEAEEKQLAQAITDEAKAMGLKGQKIPEETRSRIRETALRKILAARGTSPEEIKTYAWQPSRRR